VGGGVGGVVGVVVGVVVAVVVVVVVWMELAFQQFVSILLQNLHFYKH